MNAQNWESKFEPRNSSHCNQIDCCCTETFTATKVKSDGGEQKLELTGSVRGSCGDSTFQFYNYSQIYPETRQITLRYPRGTIATLIDADKALLVSSTQANLTCMQTLVRVPIGGGGSKSSFGIWYILSVSALVLGWKVRFE